MQKSKAQRILDDIMGSDRYAQVFSDRVFSDEPILRTGASAFRDRDKDRPSTGSATFVREMSTTPSSGPLGAPQPPQKQIQVTPSSAAGEKSIQTLTAMMLMMTSAITRI